jgi:hypothetical protein
MKTNAAKWFLNVCLLLSAAILAGGLVHRAQAHLWLSTEVGSPWPMSNANRDCFTLPDGAIQQNCSGTVAWDVVIPIKSSCAPAVCENQTGLFQVYAGAQSPSASNLVNSRLYGYNSHGVFYTASTAFNHPYSASQPVYIASHSVTIPLDGSAIMEWSLPKGGLATVVGYYPN